jgi:hypothetical protein
MDWEHPAIQAMKETWGMQQSSILNRKALQTVASNHKMISIVRNTNVLFAVPGNTNVEQHLKQLGVELFSISDDSAFKDYGKFDKNNSAASAAGSAWQSSPGLAIMYCKIVPERMSQVQGLLFDQPLKILYNKHEIPAPTISDLDEESQGDGSSNVTLEALEMYSLCQQVQAPSKHVDWPLNAVGKKDLVNINNESSLNTPAKRRKTAPKLYHVFVPVSNAGMWLQFWESKHSTGKLLYIPKGRGLLAPCDWIHAEGLFSFDGNPRLRGFIYVNCTKDSFDPSQKNHFSDDTNGPDVTYMHCPILTDDTSSPLKSMFAKSKPLSENYL